MPKKKGSATLQKKRTANDEKVRAEEIRREEEPDVDEEDATGGSERESHEDGDLIQEKANCSFSTKKEERLVEFFAVNPIFYDKSQPNYMNQQQKDKLLDQLAKELNTTRKQIQGWFKNMRSSIGKLYRTKSGQATQPLTARKKWQLQNFGFLKDYIVPRTYTVETTSLEETQSDDEVSQYSTPITTIPSPSPSTSAAPRNTKPPARKKSKIDDLLMKFLERPRPEEVINKQIETIAAAPAPAPLQPDERTAFSQWIASRMPGIPNDRWDDFQLAAMRLMQDYSRPILDPDTFPSPTGRSRPPAHQQWTNFPQQQQWGQMQTWQQQWPPRQQQQHWGASTQVQPPQQAWQQPSSSSHCQILDGSLNKPTTLQPLRQTSEVSAPRSQSVPPLLDSSINGSNLTYLLMKQFTQGNGIPSGNTSQVASSQAASPSGSQEELGND